eukprot:scaffold17798_cov22-Cyclotella_meneghiniana.AAC.2
MLPQQFMYTDSVSSHGSGIMQMGQSSFCGGCAYNFSSNNSFSFFPARLLVRRSMSHLTFDAAVLHQLTGCAHFQMMEEILS